MDSSNIYRFNGKDPFDNWTIKENTLMGYYPRNSLVSGLSMLFSVSIEGKRIVIPDGVTSICGSAFRNNTFCEEVVIPSSVKKISNTAFLNSDITLIVEPNSYSERFIKRKRLKYRLR